MPGLRTALHTVNIRPTGEPLNEKKNCLRSTTRQKDQLRLVDVNRSNNEDATVESSISKGGKTRRKSLDSKSGVEKADVKNGLIKKDQKLEADEGDAGYSKKPERKPRSKKKGSKKNERIWEPNSPKETDKQDVKAETQSSEEPAVSRSDSLNTVDVHIQTEVSVSDVIPEVTPADLVSATVSATYWRALALKLESQLNEELSENCRLFTVLSEVRSDINTVEEETEEVMKFVNEAIARGQSADQEA